MTVTIHLFRGLHSVTKFVIMDYRRYITCLLVAGRQAVISGLQGDAGRHHQLSAWQPTDSSLLRDIPAHSRRVHGES